MEEKRAFLAPQCGFLVPLRSADGGTAPRWGLQAAESDLGENPDFEVISQPPHQKMKRKPRASQKAEGKELGSHPTAHWAISTTWGKATALPWGSPGYLGRKPAVRAGE
ncbi:hypothetical protein H8959_003456 [Pygathrix nigripes]